MKKKKLSEVTGDSAGQNTVFASLYTKVNENPAAGAVCIVLKSACRNTQPSFNF